MAMSKQDYVMIAGILATQIKIEDANKRNTTGLCNVAHNLAEEMKQRNAAFDKARFLTACGVQV